MRNFCWTFDWESYSYLIPGKSTRNPPWFDLIWFDTNTFRFFVSFWFLYQPAKKKWILSGVLCFLSLLEINFLIYLRRSSFCVFFFLSIIKNITRHILLFPSSSLSKPQYPSLFSPFLIIINIMDFTNPFSQVYKWVQATAILFKFLKLYNNVIILSNRILWHCKFFKFSTNMLTCGFYFTDQNLNQISNTTNNGFVIYYLNVLYFSLSQESTSIQFR